MSQSQKFSYTAIDQNGTQVSGEREAADQNALARDLRREGFTPLSVKAEVEGGKTKFNLQSLPLLGRIGMRDKIMFAGSLSAMISAGLSLSRAIEVIGRQTHNKKFKEIIANINERVSRGEPLSNALEAYPDVFPQVFVAMVAAGEESGNLPQSLEIVRQQLSKSYDLRRKVRGAMIYPAIIVTVIIIIGILMMIFMVPNLSSMFNELHVELPLSTRVIIGISDFLSNHTIAFVITLVALIAVVIRLLKTTRGKWVVAWSSLRFPVVKVIVKNLNSAITMRTISSLVSSGVSVLEAITITERVIQNAYFKEVLSGAGAMIEKGGNLSTVFKNREDLFPVLVGEMAEVGEETGNLSGMLLKGAAIFEEEVDQATKNLSTIIEPVLMIFIGLFVGLFAVSMLGPMYSLSNNI